MKKQYLKYIFVFIVLILLMMFAIPNKTFALTSSGGYTIEGYDINMVVNEDNTFDITERITAYFEESRHRYI